MQRLKTLFLLVVLPLVACGQSLTLDECRRLAHDNWPAIRQYRLVEQTRDLTLDNASCEWLPRVSATAGATAFTDPLSPDLSRMGMTTENYAVSGAVTVRQNIYDGGAIDAGKRVAEAQAEVQNRQLDVSIYDVNERVEQLFFGILLLDEQSHQNALLQEDLRLSITTVESLLRGGMANPSDRDAVSVELVRAEQQADQLTATLESYLRMLCVFIGRPFDAALVLEKPARRNAASVLTLGENRPETAYYDAQNHLIDLQRQQLDTRLRPTVSAFGMAMLHSRVSSAVNNGALMGGVTVSWNIGALYTRKNDIARLALQREQNESQRETFLFNLRLRNEETSGAIRSMERQLAKDEEIIALRQRLRTASEKKVRMGTETVNELIRHINAIAQARQQQSLHELQLLREQYRLKTINNE